MRVFLDLDGVLADFHRGVMESFGVDPEVFRRAPRPVPWDWAYSVLGLTEAAFWGRLDVTFWEGLHWTPEGKEILGRMIERFGIEGVCVASDPGSSEHACVGKHRWLSRHLPGVECMLGRAKHFLAHRGAVLVDDQDRNCEQFVRHGGAAVLLPRPWNSLHGLDTLDYVRRVL